MRGLCCDPCRTDLYTLQLLYLLFSDIEQDIATIVQLASYQRSCNCSATDGGKNALFYEFHVDDISKREIYQINDLKYCQRLCRELLPVPAILLENLLKNFHAALYFQLIKIQFFIRVKFVFPWWHPRHRDFLAKEIYISGYRRRNDDVWHYVSELHC